jgi:hypothetical protein
MLLEIMTDESDKLGRQPGKALINISDTLGSSSGPQHTMAQMLKSMNMAPFNAAETAALMIRSLGGFSVIDALKDSGAMAQLSTNQKALDMVKKLTGPSVSVDISKFTSFAQQNSFLANLALPKVAIPETVYANYSAITDMTRALSLSIPSLVLGGTGLDSYRSAMAQAKRLAQSIHGLPDWMRPLTDAQAFQPSWEIAAGIGLAGAANPGLIRDVLSTLHKERIPTIAFEASVQMLEALDAEETDLGDRMIALLKRYVTPILDRIAEAKDSVTYAGLTATFALIVSIIAAVDGHKVLQPSASQIEMQHHIAGIDKTLTQIEEDKKTDRDIRFVVQTAPLRNAPDAKGLILRKVYPDDRVRVLDAAGKWAQVEVYEYHSEKVTQGWINRRVLRAEAR